MTTEPPWTGRAALVTGGSAGIGLAIAQALVARGVSVAVVGRSDARLSRASEQLREAAFSGANVVPLALDLTEPNAGEQAVSLAADSLGGLDHLVNNVGGLEATPIAEGTRKACVSAFDLNLFPAVACSRAALDVMGSGSSILNVGSVSAHAPSAGTGFYPVAKAALVMYTRCLALAVAGRGIRVNALSPGPVDTSAWDRLGGEQADRWRETAASRVPLGRLGTASEVAEWALRLLDPDSTWMTGSELVLDGGMTLR